MKRISGIAAAMIMAVAGYFAFAWGLDAWRIFASPTYGLDDAIGSQTVFALGRYLALSPAGLIKLGAVFGALKLVVAGVCIVHILDRVRTFFGGEVNLEIIQAGMMLAVSICLVAVLPAVLHHNPEVLREYAINLAFAAVAAALAGGGRVVAARRTVAPKDIAAMRFAAKTDDVTVNTAALKSSSRLHA
ncbi:MAG: hypothetical protein AB7O50_08900 [Pseudolabrys sp.]